MMDLLPRLKGEYSVKKNYLDGGCEGVNSYRERFRSSYGSLQTALRTILIQKNQNQVLN